MKKLSALRNPLLGKVNALAVFAAWACLAFFIIELAYLKLTATPDRSILPLALVFSAFIVLAIVHMSLSFFVRCPHCNSQLTAQGFGRPKYGDWSGTVVRWFTGSIVCIHCGSQVHTRG